MAAREGLATVMAQLRALGLPAGAAGDVELALAEVVNNVIEHGYAGKPAGEVRVEGCLSSGTLELRVSDTGCPLPGGRVPPSDILDLEGPPGDLPEGGFGWALILQLTDAVRYERRGTRNTLTLRFRVPDAGNAGPPVSQTAP